MLKIAILTPLPLERNAIMAHLPDWHEKMVEGDLYYLNQFKGLHHTYQIILRQTGAKNNCAGLAAERIIKKFQPNILLLTGIAGGVKDVKIGDIVIGTKAYGYESGKEQENGHAARPEVYLCHHALQTLAESVSNRSDWQSRNEIVNTSTKVYFGPIAAGDKVVATMDEVTYQIIKKFYNDTLAIEMEAHGVGHAAHKNGNIPWLNIRGISDLLNNKTAHADEDNQPKAAAHAAAFLFEMLYQLNAEQLNLPIMDIKTMTGLLTTALLPFLKKSKSVETITKDISEASDTTLSSIWKVIKPIFIEEFEEESDTLAEEVAEEGALNHVLKKKLKKEEGLKEQLEALLKEREMKQPTNSTVITNSKNVISRSTISAGGDFHLGDKNESIENYLLGNKYDMSNNRGSIQIENLINVSEVLQSSFRPEIESKATIESINSFVTKGKIRQAIEQLLIISKKEDSDFQKHAILLASRYNALNSNLQIGKISETTENIERNRIAAGIIDLSLNK